MTGFLFHKQGIGIFLRRISRPVKFRRNMSFIEYGVPRWRDPNPAPLSSLIDTMACGCQPRINIGSVFFSSLKDGMVRYF